MIKQFRKGNLYALCFIHDGLYGDPYTWSVNATFSEKLPDGTLKFRGIDTCYLLHKDKSAELIEDDRTYKCGWVNIVTVWNF